MALTKIPANMLSGVDLGNSVRVNLGSSNNLALFHTGGNGVIHNTTGALRIRANTFNVQDYTNEDAMITATSDGSVDLYHNNVKKFETSSSGVEVTGNSDVSGEVYVGNNNSIFAENVIRFKPSGAAYIDHNTTGQVINFRVSNSSALDTTPLVVKHTGIDVAGDLAVTGDLNITGDINSVSVTDLDVTDKTITIAKGSANASAANGAGLVVDGASASITYNNNSDSFVFNKPLTTNGVLETSTSHNFAINTPNSLRINIDSNNSGDEIFAIGHNQTGVDASNNVLFLVTASNGRVGIGATNLTDTLTIKQTNAAISIDADGASNTSAIKFVNDNERSRITSNYDTGGGGRLGFWTDTTGGSLLQRMTIKNSGSVGINTTAPDSWASYTDSAATVLQVRDTSNRARMVINGGNGAHLDLVDYAGGTDDKHMNMAVDGGILKFGSLTDAGNTFVQNNIMTMDLGNGRVGIGTASPTYTLDVAGDMGVNEYIYHNDDTNTYMRFTTDAWLVRAGGDDRIYVDGTNGRVGIGTNLPTKELDVRGGSGGGTISHAVFTGTAGRGLEIRSRSDTAGGQHSGTAEINAQDTEGNGGQLAFSTGGTIRAFLNHNGLGIGTTDPGKLGLTGSSTGKVLNLSGDDCQVRLSNSILHHDNSGNTTLHLRNHYTSLGGDNAARIKIESGTITFGSGTSYTERMRIVSNGTIHIGTGGNNEANGSTGGCSFSSDSSNRKNFICATTGTGTLELIEFRNPNGTVGDIKTSGSSTSYSTSSDYRLKENVTYSWDATTRLKQLKPARFNFKADKDTTMDGFLAHEVQDIVPQSVSGEKDGEKMQGIDHSKLVPLLVKTVQEQQTVIEDLKSRIETLEG